MVVKIFTAFDTPPNVGTVNEEPSLTRQSEADQADINKILKRFETTGVLPVDQREPMFLDVSTAPDYRTALDRVNTINRSFMEMAADVRAKFDNDPAVLLDALADPERQAELQDLGIIPKSGEADQAKDTPPSGAPVVAAPPPVA